MSENTGAYALRPNSRNNDEYSIVVLKQCITSWETFVHEIGHTLGLKHPFEMNSSFIKGYSTNFMDYSVKQNMFWHWQWKVINKNDF
jgi:predicted Zn-dependent protease